MPLPAPSSPTRDRSEGTPDLFRLLRRERSAVSREERDLAGQIRNLESFIASAPAALERHRLRFQDTLPPPDEAGKSRAGRAGAARPSRRELYERSLQRTRGLLLLGGLAIAAGAVVFAIYLLAAPGR